VLGSSMQPGAISVISLLHQHVTIAIAGSFLHLVCNSRACPAFDSRGFAPIVFSMENLLSFLVSPWVVKDDFSFFFQWGHHNSKLSKTDEKTQKFVKQSI
jgi:hypothetical protein